MGLELDFNRADWEAIAAALSTMACTNCPYEMRKDCAGLDRLEDGLPIPCYYYANAIKDAIREADNED